MNVEPGNAEGFVELLTRVLGGGVVTFIGAIGGRLMHHAIEVTQKKREPFGVELFWEMPVAIGMAFIGDAFASYFNTSQSMRVGIVAALAYLGPRGAEALFYRFADRYAPDCKQRE